MQKSIQSREGYQMLMSLIDVFEESGQDMTVSEIEQTLADRSGTSYSANKADEICSVLDAYSSDYLACPKDHSQVLCIFQNLGDQLYSLIANKETIDALRQDATAFVNEKDVPVSTTKVEILTTDQEDKGDPIPAATGLYDQPIADAADDPVYQAEADDSRYTADYSVYANNADLGAAASSDRTLETIQDLPQDAGAVLDEANAAVLQARDRAEKAEQQNAELEKKMDRLQAQNEKLQCRKEKAQNKVDRKIQKAEDRIEQQYRKIEDHEQQIRNGSMESLHKAQIRHDKKVIDRKERKIEKLTDRLSENNCED